jgi:hypothetical protein
VNWIVRQVLQPPERAEYDVDLAVKVVKSIVESLRDYIVGVPGDRLVEIFGGKSVFENILQYEEEKYPLEEMRRAAGYLLVNQILFYQVLSKADPENYMEIDNEALEDPVELSEMYFSKVLERDFTPTFGFDVASILTRRATETLSKLIGAIKALEPHKARQDILGQVFQRLIPYKVRKSVAAFYTNPNAAELLAELAIDDSEAEVMDLAAGSGTLLVAAYKRKKRLLEKLSGKFTEKDHKRFLGEQLTGIDVMPFAAHLAVVHLSIQGIRTTKDVPVFETERVRTAIWDSTELRPNTIIPEISRELKRAYRGQRKLEDFKKGPLKMEYIKKGAVTAEGVGGREISLRKVDVIIMNPPFTKQERLPRRYKDVLESRLKEYTERLHGRLGLYGYFVLLADRFLKPSGRLALVLPATVLRIASTQGIRDMLLENYDLEYIITTSQRAAFSEEAQFREILLIAKKKVKINTPQNNCLVITLDKLPRDPAEARNFAEYFKGLRQKLPGLKIENSCSTVIVTSQQELKNNSDNMFRLIATTEPRLIDIWTKLEDKNELTRLHDYLGDEEKIVRGFEMTLRGISPVSAYTTFLIREVGRAVKKHDQWVVKSVDRTLVVAENRFIHTTVRVPIKALIRALRRLSGVKKIDLTENLDFIVIKPFKGCNLLFEGNIDINVSLSRWREYVESHKTNLVFIRRFDLSAPGTILFAYYSPNDFATSKMMWCFKGIQKMDAKILTLWFNSTMNLLQVFLDRIETRGAFIGFSKYVLLNTLTLDPRELTEEQKKALLETFKNVKDVEFPSLLNQLEQGHSARKMIDKTVLRVLGFEEEEIKDLLGYLYPALHKEISRLKKLMAG